MAAVSYFFGKVFKGRSLISSNSSINLINMHFETNRSGTAAFSSQLSTLESNEILSSPSTQRPTDPIERSMSIDEHLSSMPVPGSPLQVPIGQEEIQQWMRYDRQDRTTSIFSPGYCRTNEGGVSTVPFCYGMDEMLGRTPTTENFSSIGQDIKEFMDIQIHQQQQTKNEPLDSAYPFTNIGQCMQMQTIDILGTPFASTSGLRSNSEEAMSGLSVLSARRTSQSSFDGLLRCCYCPKKWSGNEALQQHMEECKNDRPHACPQCNKRFKARGGLQQHMRIHNQDRPYECKQCDKRFTQKSHIDQHMRIHTGEKPFVCQYCGRSFRQRSQQQGHEVTHLNQIVASRAITANIQMTDGSSNAAITAETVLNVSHDSSHSPREEPTVPSTTIQNNNPYPSVMVPAQSTLIGQETGNIVSALLGLTAANT